MVTVRFTFALFVRLGDFRIGIGNQREDQAVHACARLDDVWQILSLGQAIPSWLPAGKSVPVFRRV